MIFRDVVERLMVIGQGAYAKKRLEKLRCFKNAFRQQKGQALILYTVCLGGLVGMTALAVDVGYLYASHGALQAAVDAGALAASSALPDTNTAQARAIQIAQANQVFSQPVTLQASDVEFGFYDSLTRTFTVSSVRVNAARISGEMTLSLNFGPVVGIHTADISAQAISVVRLKVTCGAVMSNETLTMSGNAVTDSYNSNNGPYDPATPGSNGRVCTNGDIDLSGNVVVNGSASPGPGRTVNISGGPTVTGSTTPAKDLFNMPSIVLGTVATVNDNGSVGLTSLGKDPLDGSGNFSLGGSETITLNTGTYYFNKLSLSGNSVLSVNPGLGPVTIYVTDSLSISGGGQIANQSGKPSDFRVFITGSSVSFSGGAVFSGLLVAPDAQLSISGDAQYFGAFVARQVTVSLASGGGIHYDEAVALDLTLDQGLTADLTIFLGA